MDTWRNGDSGKLVKEVIDRNFEILDVRTSQLANKCVLSFGIFEWKDGIIFISRSIYNKLDPCVDLYIKNDTGYSLVYGGYKIKDDGIELQSDLPYEGKVVIR